MIAHPKRAMRLLLVLAAALGGCGGTVVTSPSPATNASALAVPPSPGTTPGATIPVSGASPGAASGPSPGPGASPASGPASSSASPFGQSSAAPYAGDPQCLVAPSDLGSPAPPVALRFGITPDAAGSAGATQGVVAPEDPARAREALLALRPPGRTLVLRFNRLFESDGQAGIDAFAAKVDAAAAAGFSAEVQVRYHPGAGQDGDMVAWSTFVRAAARTLGSRAALVALSVTNEVNFPVSSNTSDGANTNAVRAIVVGIVAAREELDALGRGDVLVGFTVA